MIMNNSILHKYGHCVLPKGLRVWTDKDSDDMSFDQLMHHEIFFRLDPHECGSGSYGDTTYTCKLSKDVVCISPFSILNYDPLRMITLFDKLFVNELRIAWNFTNNVQMKRSITNRMPLVKYCKESGFDGWVAPISKSLYDMELLIVSPKKCIIKETWRRCKTFPINTSGFGNNVRCFPPAQYPIIPELLEKRKMKNAQDAQDAYNEVTWTPFDHFPKV